MTVVTMTATTDLSKLNLTGNDSIDANTLSTTIWGDWQNVPAGTTHGGADTIVSAVLASADITAAGDALNAILGASDVFTGGADRITVGAGHVNLIGDADTVLGKATGGNDMLKRTGAEVDHGTGSSVISGDFTWIINGDVTGGKDTITGATGGGGEVIVGDAYSIERGTLHAGGDLIYGGAGHDSIFGDTYLAGDPSSSPSGNPVIWGGNDTIYGGNGGSVLVGDVGFPNPAIIHGGNDLIIGGTGDDTLMGDQQNNRGSNASEVRIFGGNDSLYGGAGNDLFVGGGGNDLMNGGTGDDSVGYNQLTYDANGNPTTGGIVLALADGSNAGHASGSHGNDTLISIENVLGSLGDDSISGNSVGNLLNGSYGNDTIRGLGGDDVLIGEDGNDSLDGGAGSNYVDAGDGNDVIVIGGSGDLYALGGAGSDTFQVTGGSGFAQVFDFTHGTDHISVHAAASISIQDWGSNTGVLITEGGSTETVMLMGVHAADLSLKTDFILV